MFFCFERSPRVASGEVATRLAVDMAWRQHASRIDITSKWR